MLANRAPRRSEIKAKPHYGRITSTIGTSRKPNPLFLYAKYIFVGKGDDHGKARTSILCGTNSRPLPRQFGGWKRRHETCRRLAIFVATAVDPRRRHQPRDMGMLCMACLGIYGVTHSNDEGATILGGNCALSPRMKLTVPPVVPMTRKWQH